MRPVSAEPISRRSHCEEVDAAVLAAPRSSWRNVRLTGSRLGSMELYESNWRSVSIEGSKIDYLNARSAQWQDVRWRDCTIAELDLGQAVISRMAFEDCRIGTLHVGHCAACRCRPAWRAAARPGGPGGLGRQLDHRVAARGAGTAAGGASVDQRGLSRDACLETGARGEDDVTHGSSSVPHCHRRCLSWRRFSGGGFA